MFCSLCVSGVGVQEGVGGFVDECLGLLCWREVLIDDDTVASVDGCVSVGCSGDCVEGDGPSLRGEVAG